MKPLCGKQIARMLTLGLLIAYLFYAVCFYAREIYLYTPQMDYVDSMSVDGSEMAPITNFFIAGTNGMIGILTMGLSILSVLGVGLILLVPWRCIAIRKTSQVTETEWKFTKYLLIVFCASSVSVGFLISHFSNLLYLLILMAVPAFLISLFAVGPMHRAFIRCKLEKEEAEVKKYCLDDYIPVIRASICNGEQVAGFKEKKTGHFEEIMLIRGEKDLQDFKNKYGIESITKEY